MATAKKAPAKKAPAKKETPVEAPIASFDNIDQPVKTPQESKWEYRDRLYEITKNKKPLVYSIPSRHSAKVPLLWSGSEVNDKDNFTESFNALFRSLFCALRKRYALGSA